MAQVSLKIKIDMAALRGDLEAAVKEIANRLKAIGVIDIDFDTKELQDNLKEVTDDVEDIGKEAKSSGNELTSMAKKFVGVIGAAAALRSVFRFLIDSKNLARDADEIQSKFNVVFGELKEEANDWSEKFAASVGRATQDVKKWMGGLQDTFVPLGFSRQKAAELSKELTQLAVDVASFNNVTDEEVIDNFTSALVGNTMAVRKYGILMTENAMKQEALNMGIKRNYDSLTEIEKVQIRYNILLNSTKDAQGDLARTSDSLANKEKEQTATLKELQETIGRDLLPDLIELNELIIDITSSFIAFNAVVKDFSGEGIFGNLIRSIRNFNTMGIDLKKTLGITEELRAQLKYKKEHAEEMKVKTAEFLSLLKEQNEVTGNYVSFVNDVNQEWTLQGKTVKEIEERISSLNLDIKGLKPNTPEWIELNNEVARLQKTISFTIDNSKEKIDQMFKELRQRELELFEKLFENDFDDSLEVLGDLRIAKEEDIQRRLIDAMRSGKSKELAELDFWLQQEMAIAEQYEINKQEMITAIHQQYTSKRLEIEDKYNIQTRQRIITLANDYETHFNSLINAARYSTDEQGQFFKTLFNYGASLLQKYLVEFISTKIAEKVAHTGTETQKTISTVSGESERTTAIVTSIAAQTGASVASVTTLTATTITAMQAIAAASAAAATLVSIATMGGAGAAGLASVASALATIQAMAMGFKEGGFTGSGDPNKPAGVVHKGEYVFPAQAVKGQPDKFDFLKTMLQRGFSIDEIFRMLGKAANPVPDLMPSTLAGINLSSSPGGAATQQSNRTLDEIKSLLSSMDNRLRKLEEKGIQSEVSIKGETELRNDNIYIAWKRGQKEMRKRGDKD